MCDGFGCVRGLESHARLGEDVGSVLYNVYVLFYIETQFVSRYLK